MQERCVPSSLGQEDPMEEEMATHSSLENPLDTRDCWAPVRKELDMAEQLNSNNIPGHCPPARIAPRARYHTARVTPTPRAHGSYSSQPIRSLLPCLTCSFLWIKGSSHVPLSPSAPTTPGASPCGPLLLETVSNKLSLE